jgi:hypothetical protein
VGVPLAKLSDMKLNISLGDWGFGTQDAAGEDDDDGRPEGMVGNWFQTTESEEFAGR